MRRRRWSIAVVWLLIAASVVFTSCAPRGEAVTPRAAPTDTPGDPTSTPGETPAPSLSEATVAVAPASGPPGSELRVAVAGFPPDTEIQLGIGPHGAEPDLVATVVTDDDGAATTRLVVPSSADPNEDWVVAATASQGGAVATSNVFEVRTRQYDPAVSISPASGPPGTELQVVGEGFPSASTIEIGLGQEDSEYEVVGTGETEDDGSVRADVVVPEYAQAGERWVVVVEAREGALEAVSNVFRVVQPGGEATVALSPTAGTPGTSVKVVAEGFPPQAATDVGIGRVGSEYDVVATAHTDATGRLSTEITIPSFVDPEDEWVIVVDAREQAVRAISEEFDVTEAPTATPGDDLFTRTSIYLIALGDEGRSGKEIGCGDSVVPIEVAIEPTVAPLTAALEKLVAIESREYGQISLYNALYRSDLAVEEVSIQGREAIILLRGDLQVGGACDEPRVRAQLQQTALQYATVDQVSILVNGRPLEELLVAPTPTAEGDNLSTRASIYLVAVGDEGQSGKEIGCGDSVVPVEVAIEPTIAPLSAALEELLAAGREYGESGLYNALYRSDLELEGVDLEDGEATIRLSGTLRLGGVCDGPRVQAQLRETALQYYTVDEVSIFVEGVPLDELLTER